MTRDQWLRRCAQRFMDKAQLDAGEAAALASVCAKEQAGLNPAGWDKPEAAADEELACWTE